MLEEADLTQKRTQTTQRSTTRKAGARGRGDKALKRVTESIDAAQAALTDLRSEMSRGSRELLKDVETTLRDARKHLRNVSSHVSKDLDEVQQAVTGKRQPAKPKRAARKTAAKK